MGSGPILFAGFAQGFGLGCTFVPLNLLALSGLPHHILTQGTAIRALMRMLGGSIGIAILETAADAEHPDRAFAAWSSICARTTRWPRRRTCRRRSV